ncbi:ATP-binding cassette sub-family B member 10, mitochondrial [Tachypleus tridentatus]|uniref:ATP-binding cassette sub-family B member 10, mitochondrial n=1 Tax=Tachypleus tridentatus TaxID=6853 RepID=UPI003FD31767
MHFLHFSSKLIFLTPRGSFRRVPTNSFIKHIQNSGPNISVPKFHWCALRKPVALNQSNNCLKTGTLICRFLTQKSLPSIPIKLIPPSELRRLLQLAKPEKWRLTGAVVLLLVSSAVTMAFPFCLGKIIDIIYTSSASEMKEKLTLICKILTVVFIVGGAANFGRVYLMNYSGQRVINRLRRTLYDSVLKQEVAFFDRTKTGELINRLSADTSLVGWSITMNISDGLRSSVSVVAGISMMVYTSPELALVGMVTVPPVAGLAIVYGRYLRNITKSLQDSLADSTQVAEEYISNIRTVRAFAQEEQESHRYGEKINIILQLSKKESLARAIFFGSAGFCGNLVVLTVLYYGGLMMTEAHLTVGDLSAFLMYAAYVGISIGGLSSFFSELMRALGASTRLWEIIDRVPAMPLAGGFKPTAFKGDIEFHDLSFWYPNRPNVVIFDKLNLNIPAGSVLAVVGGSGSGKSTIAAMVLRFYDPTSGTVTLDGIDIRTLSPEWLRRHVAFVNQEPVLFSTSIKENITYAFFSQSGKEICDDLVIEAAEQANAWNFIQQFPEKLNTLVGERGVMLSGGQKQRIAIARALIKDPKILLLDEATSALDAHSEYLVQEALERLMRGRTVITIAHRLSTIRSADRIAVLHDRRIAEIGTYSELMYKKNGLFRNLVEKQTVTA